MRLIGSPKLQIIFHKRATKYRALLRKMIYKDKGSYESSPPCMCDETYSCIQYEASWIAFSWFLNSCHTYEPVTHMHESRHTREWVMSHIWMRHVAHMNETQHTYEWGTLHIWMRICSAFLIHSSGSWMCMCDMLLYMCAMMLYICDLLIYRKRWHDSGCVTWLIHVCYTTYSYVWRDVCICVTWLIRIGNVTYSYVWRVSCICVILLFHFCVVTCSYV